LSNFRLYLVLDAEVCGRKRRLLDVSRQALKAGVDIIQLRAKQLSPKEIIEIFSALKIITEGFDVPLILNDRVDIAEVVDADGVHLGQDDIPLISARRILGRNRIIGISCHSLNQCLQAQREGADYISIGPIFKTSTKPQSRPVGLNLVRKAADLMDIPFFAIGGINLDNLESVVNAGAQRIAVVREICQARNVGDKVSRLKQRLLEL